MLVRKIFLVINIHLPIYKSIIMIIKPKLVLVSILVISMLSFQSFANTEVPNKKLVEIDNFLEKTNKNNNEFEQTFEHIKKFFDESQHESLRHYRNENLKEQLAVYITGELVKLKNYQKYIPTLKNIIFYHDFRLIADYLRAIAENNIEIKNSVEKLDKDNGDYRDISFNRFKTVNNKNKKNVKFVNNIEDIFTVADTNSIVMFVPTESAKNDIQEFIRETNGFLGEYIDSNLDLEGINSLVRKGLVKKIQLPSNRTFITKKNNPDKKGRFQNELINTQKMATLLEIKNENDKITLPKNRYIEKPSFLKMLKPDAIFFDSSTQNYYSITKYQDGKTLEEVIITEKNTEKRKAHLVNATAILEHLYAKGIIWGDMAPRNIIVSEKNDEIYYYILDFEKTKILNGSVPFESRVENARGPMCVEEFGAICSREEVEAAFKDYFEPGRWDLNTKDKIPFVKPKRELIDILEHSGKKDYSFGDYNSLELQVMDVRFPYQYDNKLLYPLYASFKIDHYIGSEYDRKTTELFIKSKKHNLFGKTIIVLNNALEVVANDLILDELKISIAGKTFSENKGHNASLKLLKDLINELYSSKDKKSMEEVINNFQKEITIFINKQASHPNRSTIYRNYDFLKDKIKAQLTEAYKKYNPDLLMIAGSYARKEMTYGSDLEIFIFSKNFNEIEHYLQNEFKNNLRMDIDMYAVTEIRDINMFLSNLPDYFIDFQIAKYGAGSKKNLDRFKKIVNGIFEKPSFIYEVFKKRTIDHIYNINSMQPQIKEILNMWSTLESLENYLNIKSILSKSKHIKQCLLHNKNELEFNKYYGIKNQESIDSQFIKNTLLLLDRAYKEDIDYIKISGYDMKPYTSKISSVFEEKIKISYPMLKSFRWMKDDQKKLKYKDGKELMESVKPSSKLYVESGFGATFYTDDNREIIDFSSMTANCILGQNDPWVKLNQVAYTLSNKPSFHRSTLGSEMYFEIPRLLVNAKIGGMSDVKINHKQCNGSDVVELAIQSAYEYKKNRKYIISFKGSYHGQNLTAYLVSEKQKKHKFLDTNSDNIVFLDSPSARKVWTVPESLEDRALLEDEEKIVKDLEKIAKDSYAIILEPVQGNNHLNVFSLPLMRRIKEIAVKNDICLIFDEIQTGFGWLGKLTMAEVYGISPDILLLSKALTAGNGPLSIAVFSGKYKNSLPLGTSEKTNGADLRSLVAVKAVLERLNGVSDLKEIPPSLNKKFREELQYGLFKSYSKKVKLIEANLTNLLCDHSIIIKDKLGIGLIRGFQVKPIGNLTSIEVAKSIVEVGLSKGLLLKSIEDVVIIKPPLVVSEYELFKGFQKLSEILKSLTSSSPDK